MAPISIKDLNHRILPTTLSVLWIFNHLPHTLLQGTFGLLCRELEILPNYVCIQCANVSVVRQNYNFLKIESNKYICETDHQSESRVHTAIVQQSHSLFCVILQYMQCLWSKKEYFVRRDEEAKFKVQKKRAQICADTKK